MFAPRYIPIPLPPYLQQMLDDQKRADGHPGFIKWREAKLEEIETARSEFGNWLRRKADDAATAEFNAFMASKESTK